MVKPEFKRLYRLDSTRHKKYFFEDTFDSLYDGMVVGAQVAAYYKGMISSIAAKRDFIIDPMTYMFAGDRDNMTKQKDNEDGDSEIVLKKSYEKIAEAYGITDICVTKMRSLMPSDFNDANFEKEFCKKVLAFQMKFTIRQTTLPQDIMELMDEEQIRDVKSKGKLYALVPPYFYSDDVSSKWYEISLRMAQIAEGMKERKEICPLICISKNILMDSGSMDKIVKDYSKWKRVIVWVSDFDETKVDTTYLKALIDLIKAFSKKRIGTYIAYGGYFSALLFVYSLKGFAQGMCYSEKKAVDRPPAVSAPTVRYYFPCLHKKVPIEYARTYLSRYPGEICDCKICNQAIKAAKKKVKDIAKEPGRFIDEFFAHMDEEKLLEHFLICREKEIDDLTGKSVDDARRIVQSDLVHATDKNMTHPYEKLGYDHLKRWIDALS